MNQLNSFKWRHFEAEIILLPKPLLILKPPESFPSLLN